MKIFITGGTGSLGSRIVQYLYDVKDVDNNLHQFVIFSRDEQKQYAMGLNYPDESRVKFILGDVRDQTGIMDAIVFSQPDIVIHTAAQKHVKISEHNPMQCTLTNIHGTKHVVRACLEACVPVACFVSTDKTVEPTTLYGMTKHIAERIWENASKRQGGTKFTGVRYGNIINSVGSLLPLYCKIANTPNPVFPVTHPDMTRFFLTFDQAIELIIQAINDVMPGIISVPINAPAIHCIDKLVFRIPEVQSLLILDIAELFAERTGGKVDIIGPFESEKIHESMVPGYSSKDFVMSRKQVEEFLDKEGLLPKHTKYKPSLLWE